MQHLIVLTTVSNEADGLRLAKHLVGKRLVACANLQPSIRSVYHWKDELHEDAECMLLLKTREDCYEALEAELMKAHPYDLPELVALPVVRGSAGYLGWLDENLAAGS